MTSIIIGFVLDSCVILIYSILLVFTVIGAILYTYAFRRMKRSKIIASIATLFYLLALDSFWWLMTTIHEMYMRVHTTDFTHPIAIIVIKGLLAFAVILFIIRSIRDESIDDPLSVKGQEKLF